MPILRPKPDRSQMHRAATDLESFHDMAQRAIAALPAPYRDAARAIAISVIDLPPDDILDDLGIDDALELTGLYDGIPLTEKSFADQAEAPDMIWLFRKPILTEWRARGDVELADLIMHVLVHELAHHFGWTDDDIARIDRWWE